MGLRDDSTLALETKGLNIKKTLVLWAMATPQGGMAPHLAPFFPLRWTHSTCLAALYRATAALGQGLKEQWLSGLHSRLTNNSGVLE